MRTGNTTPLRPRGPALRLYQASVLQSLIRGLQRHRGATFTVLFPRQAGKNEVAAALVAYLLRSNAASGGSVIVCAPSFHPQAEISIARLRRTLETTAHLFPGAPMRISGHTVSVGRASATFLSAAPDANVAGHTASLALIADEAQDIDPDWFDRQFRPMAASTGAPTIMFGTPWEGSSLLDRAVAANRAADAASGAHGPDRLHHEVSWQRVAESVPAYGRYVEHERERLGANHPLFLTQYELRIARSAGRLLTTAQLARLSGSHERQRTPRPGERYVAGLDLAGPGNDRTVLTIARLAGSRAEVVDHTALQGSGLEAAEQLAREALRTWRLERLCLDATGLGLGIAERLAREFGSVIEPFVFTAQSKSELGYALVTAAELGTLALYADDGSAESAAVRQELRDCAAEYAAGRQLRWHAARGHDDYAISLALCLRAANTAGAPRLARGRSRE